jgi:two-component system cell cycle sensor histidine kinase/response regulator CckA
MPTLAALACVLVVDDEPLALQIVGRTLREAGYRTLEATGARQALTLIAQAHPPIDLVVTDIVMPETDGRTLGRMIGERHPSVPIIYMSGYPATDMFHRGGSPNPLWPFLQKPFSPDALLQVVRHLLARRSAAEVSRLGA